MKSQAPPRVGDDLKYWTTAPPELSARCLWWENRIHAGWRPNKRIRSMGYFEASAYFGVHIWEWINALSPLISGLQLSVVRESQ